MLKIEGMPLRAIIAALIIFVGLVGGIFGLIPVIPDSEIARAIIFIGLFGFLIYLLATSVWKRSIVVNLDKGHIIISESCPYLFKPKVINIADMFHVGVRNNDGSDSGQGYTLAFKAKEGKVYSFGDGSDADENKYFKWAEKINDFIK